MNRTWDTDTGLGAWFMENMSISQTEKDRFMTYMAFYGKQKRHYAACLTNAVNNLVAWIQKISF